jgi:hypothetical protein
MSSVAAAVVDEPTYDETVCPHGAAQVNVAEPGVALTWNVS